MAVLMWNLNDFYEEKKFDLPSKYVITNDMIRVACIGV